MANSSYSWPCSIAVALGKKANVTAMEQVKTGENPTRVCAIEVTSKLMRSEVPLVS